MWKDLTDYLHKARRSLFQPLCCDLVSSPDKIFKELKTQTSKTPLHDQVRQAWIPDETWAAMDARVTESWEGSQRTLWKLSRQIYAGLSMDRKRRPEEAGNTI